MFIVAKKHIKISMIELSHVWKILTCYSIILLLLVSTVSSLVALTISLNGIFDTIYGESYVIVNNSGMKSKSVFLDFCRDGHFNAALDDIIVESVCSDEYSGYNFLVYEVNKDDQPKYYSYSDFSNLVLSSGICSNVSAIFESDGVTLTDDVSRSFSAKRTYITGTVMIVNRDLAELCDYNRKEGTEENQILLSDIAASYLGVEKGDAVRIVFCNGSETDLIVSSIYEFSEVQRAYIVDCNLSMMATIGDSQINWNLTFSDKKIAKSIIDFCKTNGLEYEEDNYYKEVSSYCGLLMIVLSVVSVLISFGLVVFSFRTIKLITENRLETIVRMKILGASDNQLFQMYSIVILPYIAVITIGAMIASRYAIDRIESSFFNLFQYELTVKWSLEAIAIVLFLFVVVFIVLLWEVLGRKNLFNTYDLLRYNQNAENT